MADERVGVVAEFDVEAFEKGLNRYLAGLDTANKATKTFADEVSASVNRMANNVGSTLRTTGANLTQFGAEYNTFLSNIRAPQANAGLGRVASIISEDLGQQRNDLQKVSREITDGVGAFIRSNNDLLRNQRTAEVVDAIGATSARLLADVEQAKQRAQVAVQQTVVEALRRPPADANRLTSLAGDAVKQATAQNNASLARTISEIRNLSIGPSTSPAVKSAVEKLENAVKQSNAELISNLQQSSATIKAYTDVAAAATKQNVDAKIVADVGRQASETIANITAAREAAIAAIQQAMGAASSQGYVAGFASIKDASATIRTAAAEADKQVDAAVEAIRAATKGTNLAPQTENLVANLRSSLAQSNQQLITSFTTSAAAIQTALSQQRGELETAARAKGGEVVASLDLVGKQSAEFITRLNAARTQILGEIQTAITAGQITNTSDPSASIKALQFSVKQITEQNEALVSELARQITETVKGQKINDLKNQIVADLRSAVLQSNTEITLALRDAKTTLESGFKDSQALLTQVDYAKAVTEAGARAATFLSEVGQARAKALADIQAAVVNAAKSTPQDARDAFAAVAQANQALRDDIDKRVSEVAATIRASSKGEGVSQQINSLISDMRTQASKESDLINAALKDAAGKVSNIADSRKSFDPTFVVQQAQIVAADLVQRVTEAQARAVAQITQLGAQAAAQSPKDALATLEQIKTVANQVIQQIDAEMGQIIDRLRASAQGVPAKAALSGVIGDLQNQIRQSNDGFRQALLQVTNQVKGGVAEKQQAARQQEIADSIREAGRVNADFIKRVEAARAKALEEIANAINSGSKTDKKTGRRSLSTEEFAALRDRLRTIQNEITRDLQQTVNTMRNLGSNLGTSFTGKLNAEIINTRNIVKQAMGDINSSLRSAPLAQAGNFATDFALKWIKGTFALKIATTAVDILGNALRGLGNLINEGVETVAFFDRLGFALETTVALGIRKATDYTLSMADALKQAQKPAKGVQLAIEEIALLSPFSLEDISDAVKISNAYGFTVEKTLELTQALTDLGAARGIKPQNLQLIARALGQISTKGKLYAQEANQLGEQGLNISEILIEEGKLTEELRQKRLAANEPLAEGAEVLEAVLSFSKKNFTGTAERAAFSLGGLIETFKGLRQIALRSIFEGLLEPLEPLLVALAKLATTDEFRANLIVLGEVLGGVVLNAIKAVQIAFKFLSDQWDRIPARIQKMIIYSTAMMAVFFAVAAVIGTLLLAFKLLGVVFLVSSATLARGTASYVANFESILSVATSVVTYLGQEVGKIGNFLIQVQTYGLNIIVSFAEGITAAVNYVTQALQVIGSLITYWLEPGSPPRLLPNLDKWGTGAAEAYLEGFTQADFSILDSLANQFKTYFSSLVAQGKEDERFMPGLTIGIRRTLAEALSEINAFGAASQETLSRLASLGGSFGANLTGYITRYATLSVATKQATQAQEALNAITKKYDDILKPLQRRLAEVQDTRARNDEAKEARKLQNIINSRFVTETRRTAAQLELEELLLNQQIRGTNLEKDAAGAAEQAALDAANLAQKAADDELKNFEARVNQQVAINQLLGEEQQILDRLAKEAQAKIKELLEKQAKAVQLQRDELTDVIRLAEIRYRLANDELTTAEKVLLNLEQQQIAQDRLNRAKEAAEIGLDLTPIANTPVSPADFLSDKELKGADEAAVSLKETLDGTFNADLTAKVDAFNEQLEASRKKFGEIGEKIKEAFGEFKKAFGFGDAPTVPASEDFLTLVPTVTAGPGPGYFDGIINAFFDSFNTQFDAELLEQREQLFVRFNNLFGTELKGNEEFLANVAKNVGGPIANAAFEGIVSNFKANIIEGKWYEQLYTLTNPDDEVTKILKERAVLKLGTPIGEGIIKGVDDIVGTNWIDQVQIDIVKRFRQQFLIQSPSQLMRDQVGTPIGEGLVSGVEDGVEQGIFASIKESVLDTFTKLRTESAGIFSLFTTETEESFTKTETDTTSSATDTKNSVVAQYNDMQMQVRDSVLLLTNETLNYFKLWSESLVGATGVIPDFKTTFESTFKLMATATLTILRTFFTTLMTLLTGEDGLLAQLQLNFADKGFGLGEDFAGGIALGMVSKLEAIRLAAETVTNTAMQTGMENLETGSPSKRASRDLGVPFTEGLIQGMLSKAGALSQSTEQIVTSMFGFADAVEQRMGLSTASSSVTNNSSRVNNFNLSVATQQSTGNVVRDFGTLRAFAGG